MRRWGEPVFVAFDVLRHGKQDLRAWPLWRRKKRLRQIIPTAASSVLYADYVEREGVALYQEAVRRDLEGIVAKYRTSAYDPSQPWIKAKNPTYTQKEGRHELFHAEAEAKT
jgi:bifunctional non-homologous end joining protein LigD